VTEKVSYDRYPATPDGEHSSESSANEPPSREHRITFAKVAQLYVENGGDPRHLAPLIKSLGHRLVDEVDQLDIEQTAAEICGKLSPATHVRQVYTPISAILKFAAKRGWRNNIRIQRPRIPKSKAEAPTQEELDSFARAAGPGLKRVIRFKIETGATEHEMLTLEWSRISVSDRQAILRRADGTERIVALSPTLVEGLVRRSHNQIGRVFRRDNKDGDPYSTSGSYGGRLKAAFKGASKRSGITITFSMLHRIWRARHAVDGAEEWSNG
jgi:integrase